MSELTFVTCPRCGRQFVNEVAPHTDWRGQPCPPPTITTEGNTP